VRELGGFFISHHSTFIHPSIIEIPIAEERKERKEERKEGNKRKSCFVYQ